MKKLLPALACALLAACGGGDWKAEELAAEAAPPSPAPGTRPPMCVERPERCL